MPSATTFFLVFATVLGTGYAIQCFECNSNAEEACKDPFDYDAAVASGYLKDCHNPQLVPAITQKDPATNKTYKYSFCRKTTQKASLVGMKDEDKRVIRSCGFLNDTKLVPASDDDRDKLKCYRKVGTFEVEMYYCACYSDKCNPAGRLEPFLALGGSLIFGMIFAKFF